VGACSGGGGGAGTTEIGDAGGRGRADAGPPTDKTVGLECKTNDDCDVTKTKKSACGNASENTIDPTPVCVGTCTLGDGKSIVACDSGLGVCVGDVARGPTGQCIQFCEWDGDKLKSGCTGKNVCNVYGWGRDPKTKAPIGVGYCQGGCTADADCTKGNRCQKELGACVAGLIAFTKSIGDACDRAKDGTSLAKKTGGCPCVAERASGLGYCSTVCKTADPKAACPTGYTCDPGLPARDKEGPLFSAVAAGLFGSCFKNCAADGDCAGLNSYCDDTSATGQKICTPGKKPG
jgi:hypothetical protein